MRHIRIGVIACAIAGASAVSSTPAAFAQSAPKAAERGEAQDLRQVQEVRDELERLRNEFDALRQEYERRMSSLEQRLGGLSGPRVIEQSPLPPAPAPAPDPVGAPQDPQPVPAAAYSAGSKVFNPDISAIGNFLAAGGENPHATESSMQLTEAELAFQAPIDPYARADFFLSAGPEGVEIEEGYVTFTALPAGLLLKAGKMRAQFGKVNAMHTHILPWTDRPLVMQNLLGGEEGLADSGLSLSRLIPNSFMFLEGTGEVYQGRSNVFQTDTRSRLAYLGRLRGYRDLTESTNFDLGTSFVHGPTDLGTELDKNLIGVDATFRWRPLQRAIYRQFVGRTELVWSRQALPFSAVPGAPDRAHAFGFYSSADYQFARRWFAGARVDRSGRVLSADLTDTGASLHLTFRPTEFSLIRGQYRRTNYAEGISANELLFQLNFSIGAHGAHVF
jgi:hypothetical protein